MSLPAARRWTEEDHGHTSPCWIWQGWMSGSGYGLAPQGAKTGLAHRIVYELLVGAIPAGLELDHLCRVPRCVNPDHLDPVTHAENVRRGMSPSARLHRAGHCARGHDVSHSYRRADGRIAYCRICKNERRRAPRAAAE